MHIFLCTANVWCRGNVDLTVRFPYGVLLKVTQPLVCKCQCAPSHLPANRHEDLWGKWGVTYGPTHARLRKLLLWCGELIGLQVEKQPLVPDVDCKYPAIVYTTHVGAGLSLRHPSFPFFMSLLQNSGRVFFSLHKYWEMYSKSLEMMMIDCWVVSMTPRVCPWGQGPGPYVVWWRCIRKRNVMNECRHLLTFFYMKTNNQIKVT